MSLPEANFGIVTVSKSLASILGYKLSAFLPVFFSQFLQFFKKNGMATERVIYPTGPIAASEYLTTKPLPRRKWCRLLLSRLKRHLTIDRSPSLLRRLGYRVHTSIVQNMDGGVAGPQPMNEIDAMDLTEAALESMKDL